LTTKPALFLDTTIQIERVVGSRARQAALHRELASYRLVTSSYVLGEYLRTLVRDAVYLHRLVLEQEHLDDVITAIAQHINKREASRMLLLWANVHREGMYGQAHIADQLEAYVMGGLVRRFMFGIETLLDATECGLARERAEPLTVGGDPGSQERYRLRAQCIRRVRECALAERLGRWQEDVRRISQALGNSQERALARLAGLAEQILTDPVLARGRNCTRYLGDMVIALELPPDVPLYTTNRKHFEPLLQALGKRLYTSPESIETPR
jgi:predicted nucleic acid-binding protein